MHSPRRPTVWTLALLTGALYAALPDRAQAVERSGLIFGGGVGVGWIQCDGCDTLAGLAVEFHTGWMLTDRLALVIDGASVMHPEMLTSPFLQSTIGGIGARYFLGKRVWIQAVVGLGRRDSTKTLVFLKNETGPGFLAGAGFEILQKRKFAIDASLRTGGYGLDGGSMRNVSMQVGLNFY